MTASWRPTSVFPTPWGPILGGAGLVVLSVLSRLAVTRYAGPHAQLPFNAYLFSHGWWAYTDIASLFFRDGLWRHPLPYFDYRLEYPVLTGAFIGLVSQVTSGVTGYFLLTAAILGACGMAVLALVDRVDGSKVWLLALSPALALYAVMNWDLFALALTVGALLLYLRSRDLPASALLALATSAKLFPILLLPFALLVQLRERRWRTAFLSATVFLAVTLAVNLPVALTLSNGGLAVRKSWAYFFDYNQARHPEVNIWRLVAPGLHTGQVNDLSTALVLAVLATLLVLVARRLRVRPSRLILVPAFGAALAGALFLNKVYSPQYSLWLMAALALAGTPLLLAVVFAAVDVLYDYASFHIFAIRPGSAHHRFYENVLLPSGAVREAVVLAVFAWFTWRLLGRVDGTASRRRLLHGGLQ